MLAALNYHLFTIVWKKLTVGYFCVKFVCGKIFLSLGISNEKNITFLFIFKNNLFVQFSSCHTSDENFLASIFSQTTVYHYYCDFKD